ncbi:hypothetical protein CR970_01730 [Candidatus Saccharibacteria bacterium]|nr:MAG: hypothetical protein CR970_01730 [Candidatus Saccharibacteria bacterium]
MADILYLPNQRPVQPLVSPEISGELLSGGAQVIDMAEFRERREAELGVDVLDSLGGICDDLSEYYRQTGGDDAADVLDAVRAASKLTAYVLSQRELGAPDMGTRHYPNVRAYGEYSTPPGDAKPDKFLCITAMLHDLYAQYAPQDKPGDPTHDEMNAAKGDVEGLVQRRRAALNMPALQPLESGRLVDRFYEE